MGYRNKFCDSPFLINWFNYYIYKSYSKIDSMKGRLYKRCTVMKYLVKELEGTKASFECFIHGDYDELAYGKRDSIIVCPGGGYAFLSEREAEPVALRYFAAGLNVFILRYSIWENAGKLNPVTEALTLIRHIRENGEEYNTTDKVFITGFSAGGHLAASCGVLFDHPALDGRLEGDRNIYRPDGMILCYPVITAGEWAHRGSIDTVSGKDPELVELFGLENHVKENTCPAFIWHTFSDACVPVQNALMFASKMVEYKVPCELHIYPAGPHGLSLCNKETWSNYPGLVVPYAEGWCDMAINWIKKFGNHLS